ncbi:hypothetical protein WJX72_010740 [[Myrmecia] bisecta]|uniref:Vacuolar protein sorting-associated protein 8 central domain-containing protein n=1 Tax=[Myrmecia] bisecta TaxID=41462 RepID=A0AAW1P7D5_9CHLO
MASKVDLLLEDLLTSSDEEEDQVTNPQPGAPSTSATHPNPVTGTPPVQSTTSATLTTKPAPSLFDDDDDDTHLLELLAQQRRSAQQASPLAMPPSHDDPFAGLDLLDAALQPASGAVDESRPAVSESGVVPDGASVDDVLDALSGSDSDFGDEPELVASAATVSPLPSPLPSPEKPGLTSPPPERPSTAPNASGPVEALKLETSAAPPDVVQAHEAALAEAEALERRLVTGAEAEHSGREHPPDLFESLRSRLQWAGADWPADGAPDARGSLLGGSVCMRLDALAAFGDVVANHVKLGAPRALAAFRGIAALGTASGCTFVLMPRGISAEGKPSGQPAILQLGEPKTRDDGGVSCLAFSPQGNLLVVGHADGDVAFWEFRRSAWEPAKIIKDAHVTAVVAVAFVEGPQACALSADSRGRIMFHPVSGYLSLTAMFTGRLTKGSQATLLLDGKQLGPVCRMLPLAGPPPRSSGGQRGGGAEAADLSRMFFAQEGGALEGVVLLCASQAVYVARLSPDGRLAIFHNIPRPPDVREEALPYAAWRLKSQAAGRSPANTPTHMAPPCALLALAWEQRVMLLEVPLLLPPRPPASQEGAAWQGLAGKVQGLQARAVRGGSEAAPEPGPTLEELAAAHPVRLVRMWEAPQLVVGAHWLAGPALALVMEHGPRTYLSIYSATGSEVRERVAFDDCLVGQAALINRFGSPEQAYHAALAGSTERLLLLATEGVRTARLLSWQERLAALRDMGAWEHALHLGLAALQVARSSQAASTPGEQTPDGPLANAELPWPGAGRGADVAAIATALQNLLLGYLDAALPQAGQQPQHGEAEAQVAAAAAETAIEVCLVVRRPAVLWEEVFPRFQAGRVGGVLLEHLQPHILADQLPTLAPEVMQALVEHFSRSGRPDAVERCVLHMDIASLDFNQVVRLCRLHRLHSALIYIFNRGLNDYTAPTAELLLAMLYAGGGEGGRARRATGYKLLVYLRCCLTGQAFPPGGGALPAEVASLVKAQVLAFLLYTGPAGLQSVAGGQEEQLGGQAGLDDLLPGPHPVLRCLASFDAGAVLMLLSEGLDGWDALETDLLEAIGQKQPPETTIRSAAQLVVDAVVALLEADVFRQADSGADAAATARALDFVSGMLAAGRASARAGLVMLVLQYIAIGPWLPDAPRPPPGQQEDRFVSVLRNASQDLAASRHGLRGLDVGRALGLAQQAGFQRASAAVHHLSGNFRAALDCSLRDAASPAAPFKYIKDVLDEPGTSAERLGRFRAAVLAAMPRLTQADGQATAALVLERFPEQQKAVIMALQDSPELQYKYLRGALQAAQAQQAAAAEGAEAANGGTEPLAQHKHAGGHGKLLAQAQVCELYMRLLCQFEPASVLPFLQAQDSYRVEVGGAPLVAAREALKAAIALCQRHTRDARPEAAQQLWFDVLQCYVELLRELRREEQALPQHAQHEEAPSSVRSQSGKLDLLALSPPRTPAAQAVLGLASPDPLARLSSSGPPLGPAATAGERLASLQHLLTALMEEVISHMAGYVPLKAIGDRIIRQYNRDPFGDFKGTLLGLLAAYNYEFSILKAANRLMAADAFRTLYALYRSRTHPTEQVLAAAHRAHALREGSTGGSDEAGPSHAPVRSPHRSPSGRSPEPSRMQALQSLNSGTFGTSSGKLMGLSLVPAAERRRLQAAPPARSAVQAAMLQQQQRASAPQHSMPSSPAYRSGVDINYLRTHDVHVL